MSETWLIVGGTGTFGREAVRQLLADSKVRKVRILSRDERKQAELKADFRSAAGEGRLLTMLGDVRELGRVDRACEGATHVLHAAALKRVEACQADVEECIQTNVLGTLNVAKAAERQGVDGAVLISSDKAADPVAAYGVSKAMAEQGFLSTHRAWGGRDTRLMAVRYGNVWGSRGSVVEAWAAAAVAGRAVELRSPSATRYWLSIERGVHLAIHAARQGRNGFLYVPRMVSASLGDLAEAFGLEVKVGALLDAEKMHERLLTDQELERASLLEGFAGDRVAAVWAVPPVTGSRCAASSGQPWPEARSSACAPRLTIPQLAAAIQGEDVWASTR